MNVDEQIGLMATAASLYTPQEYRDMFIGAIEIQRENIKSAERIIEGYEDALLQLAGELEVVANDNDSQKVAG
jgi:hypothetical protein